MPTGNKEKKETLLKLVQEALQQDQALREKYQIGEKFRFVRDRLQALFTHIEEALKDTGKEKEETRDHLLEDEILIYIYLYNTQGTAIRTWLKMLNPAVFYEYSVNRPLYTEKSAVEAFIRGKTNRAHHGYLTIAIKKQFILKTQEPLKDAMGGDLIRVKEGSLHFNKLKSLTHNGIDYVLNEENELVKK